MEERNNQNNYDWYRAEPAPAQEVTDLFEEAGLYQVRSRDELLKANRPKPRKRGLIIGIVCGVLLLSAIVITAKLFGGDSNQAEAARDFFDVYQDFYEQTQQDDVTGEYPMERAPTCPELELELQSAVGEQPMTLQELYAKCAPTIVGIRNYQDGYAIGWGSGVIMTEDGYIITNAHVVDAAESVDVLLQDGSEYPAKLVGADTISDIALLKIEKTGLPYATFLDSDLVCVGETVAAIGNPLDEDFLASMSQGIVSGVSRPMDFQNRTMTLLQTDAALNGGNSGGALFNVYGQVIGITNMKIMGSFVSPVEGVGFAIPTATVKEMVDGILDEGAVVGRPGLGITVYDLSDLTDLNEVMEDEYDYPTDGMLVNSVAEGSDAEAKGLQIDDIILSIDGKDAESIDVIREAIAEKQVGDTVAVTVWRLGEIIELEIALIDQNDF